MRNFCTAGSAAVNMPVCLMLCAAAVLSLRGAAAVFSAETLLIMFFAAAAKSASAASGAGRHRSRGDSFMRLIAEFVVCVVSSLALSRLSVFTLPQGGALSLEMAPLIFFSFRRGVRFGVLAGAVTGCAASFLDGMFEVSAAFLLDYPIAYGCIGISGADRVGELIAGVSSALLRLTIHTISGVLFYAEYAPQGLDALSYSLLYNGSFMIPSIALSMAAVWMVQAMAHQGAFSEGGKI